jgi:mannose/fructose/N-acetylgalactosamine-specific phosphotransferase system component IIC
MKTFHGRVEESAIASIEFSKPDTGATTLVILGGLVVVVGIGVLIAFANSFSSWGHWSY